MLWEIFITFFKVGLFTIGGGYAMLSILQRELIRKCWMTNEEYLDAISLTNSLPGPVVVNGATFMGYKIKGVRGAIVAVAGAITPSIIVIIIIASVFSKVVDNNYVQYFFAGARPAVCALLIYTVFTLGKAAKLGKWQNAALAVGSFISLGFLGFSHVLIIAISAIMGIIVYSKSCKEGDGDNEPSS